jgi:glycosyltransferase involved in cell wall biosynthesis
MRLSAVMVVKNEEEKLAGALASVEELAQEIVVVDTGSTDATQQIAMEHPKVKLLRTDFAGFGAAKQFALEAATGDWVLVMDADERVSPELAAKLRQLESNEQLRGQGGYRIRMRNFILGREMRTMGLAGDYKLRFFRREGARFSSRLVHEGIEMAQRLPVGRLDEPLDHYTFGGVDSYLRKNNLYTSLEIAEGGRSFSVPHLIFAPPSTFLRFYMAREGWRDGFPGFLWASLMAMGVFMRDVKLWIASLEGRGPN